MIVRKSSEKVLLLWNILYIIIISYRCSSIVIQWLRSSEVLAGIIRMDIVITLEKMIKIVIIKKKKGRMVLARESVH